MSKSPFGPAEEVAQGQSYYADSMSFFEETAELLGLDERVRMELRQPNHEVLFHITTDLKDRLVPLTEAELGQYGAQLAGLPESRLDPDGYTVLADGQIAFRARLSVRFMYKLKPFIGPNVDIPALDVGTNSVIMGHFFRQFTDGEHEPHRLRGCVTGKDVRIWGSEGREQATGRGLFYCIEEWLRHKQSPSEEVLIPAEQVSYQDLSFTLQGFGDVGANLARILVPHGATMVAVDDRDGTIYNPRGIDIIPDVIANAGGVIVSYYEWLQNFALDHWSEAHVNTRLCEAIKSNYNIILDIAANRPRATKTQLEALRAGTQGADAGGGDGAGTAAAGGAYRLEGFSN